MTEDDLIDADTTTSSHGVVSQQADNLEGSAHGRTLGMLTGDSRSPLVRLRLDTLRTEMVRRLPGYGLRSYALCESTTGAGATGDVTHPLLPWSVERAHHMAGQLDAVIVVCSLADTRGPQLKPVLADLATAGMPLHFLVVDSPPGIADDDVSQPWWSQPSAATWSVASTVPRRDLVGVVDPLALCAQLFASPLLEQRLDYLRLLEAKPSSKRFVLVMVNDPPSVTGNPMGSALDTIGRRLDADIVTIINGPLDREPSISLDARRYRSIGDFEPIDVAATVAGAALVVTDVPAVVAMARGMRRPVVPLDPAATSVGSAAAALRVPAGTDGFDLEVAATRAMEDDTAVDGGAPEAGLEMFLDDLADAITLSIGRPAAQSAPERIQELVEEIGVLEAANRGLRRTLVRERSALAARANAMLAGQLSPDVSPITAERFARKQEHLALQHAQSEIAKLRFELDALYGTRTMRAVQPARRVYSKLRSLRR